MPFSPHSLRFAIQVCEEVCNGFPDLFSTAQTLPGEAYDADELVARINRHDIVHALLPYPIDEERFNLWFQFLQDGVIAHETLPVLQTEQRFYSACGTGVKRHDMLSSRLLSSR